MIKKDQASTLPTYLVFAFLSYSANSAAYLVRIFRAEGTEIAEVNSEESHPVSLFPDGCPTVGSPGIRTPMTRRRVLGSFGYGLEKF